MLIKNSNVEYLKKEYKISESEAIELDKKIRGHVKYELEEIEIRHDEFLSFLENSIPDKCSSSDRRRKRKKLYSTIKHYERNYGRIINQNNLFALMGAIGSLICMIYQLINYSKDSMWANVFNCILFFTLACVWLVLDNLVKDRSDVRKVLTVINDECPLFIFFANIFFYMLLTCYSNRNVDVLFYLIGIAIVLFFIVGITYFSIFRLRERREQ